MGYLESQFCENGKNEFGVNNGKYIEENWQKTVRMEQQDLYSPFFDTMINKVNMINDILLAHARRIWTIAKNSDVKKKMFGRTLKNSIFPRVSTRFKGNTCLHLKFKGLRS